MTRTQADTLARALMTEHGLQDWSLVFDRGRRRLGSCNHAARTLTLSRYLVDMNGDAEVRDVILHEIAHALHGPRRRREPSHGWRWRSIAARIGARPCRCNETAAIPEPTRYRVRCKGCGYEAGYHRLTKVGIARILNGSRWHARCGRTLGRLYFVNDEQVRGIIRARLGIQNVGER